MYQQPQRVSDSVNAYSPYPSTNHYPNQYPAQATSSQSALPFTFPSFPHQPQPPLKQDPIPPLPVEPAITPDIASATLRRLIFAELSYAGFKSADQPAVQRFELEVAAFVQQLFERAHEYANLANRADLHSIRTRTTRKRKRSIHLTPALPELLPPTSRSPSPELLPSDDDDAPPAVPVTLRGLPAYFPTLPPKHTYLRTPVSPPKKAALPSLEKKLKTAGLVQESLQNLLLATEENTDREDGELLGHIVNWETGIHPRKRWRVKS
ncbi:hypothetical protein BDQ17DRAFT_70897 [Cyathus striatus]|nr:hypothetical protein BDQ17DRAFT_70897 [Cyathus striatus]